jgi:hypothetical protein
LVKKNSAKVEILYIFSIALYTKDIEDTQVAPFQFGLFVYLLKRDNLYQLEYLDPNADEQYILF